jgi:uncharacterized protein (TIGR03437 family)
MLMSIFGSYFATSPASASSVPLPLSLGGVSVVINGVTAPLFYVSSNQLNVQVPFETAPGQAHVTVTANGLSTTASVQVSTLLPGIFTDGQRIVPFPRGRSGDVLILYITGQGLVSPAVATGGGAPAGTAVVQLPQPVQPLSLTIGGLRASILFAGIPPGLVGVTQINFQVPDGLAPGDYPVVVTVGGQQSPPAMLTITR